MSLTKTYDKIAFYHNKGSFSMDNVDNWQRYEDIDISHKNILITGAAGFIGSNLVEYFATYHPKCRILALDYFRDTKKFDNGHATTLGHFKNLHLYKNVEILPLDISNYEDLKSVYRRCKRIDYIFHQAAISDTTCMDMKRVLQVNLESFNNLLRLAMKYRTHIIYASSAATYGNSEAPNSVGKGEIPENIYGYSKLCMDSENRRMQKVLQDMGLGLIGLRYFNVYGKNEFYKHKMASMILQLSLQAFMHGEVRLFEFGEQERDFVYIKDVIQANVKALELIWLIYGHIDNAKQTSKLQKIYKTFNDSALPSVPSAQYILLKKMFGDNFKENIERIMSYWLEHGAVYNVGFGESVSYNRVVELLKRYLDTNFSTTYIKNPYPFFQQHTLADSNFFLPNYKPSYNIELGIKDYIPHIDSICLDIKEGRKSWGE